MCLNDRADALDILLFTALLRRVFLIIKPTALALAALVLFPSWVAATQLPFPSWVAATQLPIPSWVAASQLPRLRLDKLALASLERVSARFARLVPLVGRC